jgi:hypothetical protein
VHIKLSQCFSHTYVFVFIYAKNGRFIVTCALYFRSSNQKQCVGLITQILHNVNENIAIGCSGENTIHT